MSHTKAIKRFFTVVICFMLVAGFTSIANAATDYEAESIILPALYLQLDMPKEIRADIMDTPFFQVEYDLGMRYEGENDDLSISIWAFNNLGGMSGAEYADTYATSDLAYHVVKDKLNGYDAYRIWRDEEPDSVGYIITDESDETDPDVAYTIFFNTATDAGEALRDEIISTLRAWAPST